MVETVHRHDLLGEAPGVHRGDRALVRAQRPRILVVPLDAELPGHARGLLDHVAAVEGRGETVMDHVVDDLAVAEPVAEAGLRQQVRRVGHGLHPTGDDDVLVAGADHLVGERDRAHPGGADLVDGLGADLQRQARGDLGLTGRNLSDPGLQDLAHDHVLDVRIGHVGAAQRLPDRLRAELHCGEAGQPARELPERRPGGAQDHAPPHEASLPTRPARQVDAGGNARVPSVAMTTSVRTWWAWRPERGGSVA